MTDWTLEDARRIYNLAYWGAGYVDVNVQVHLSIRPRPQQDMSIDLYELVQAVSKQLTLPFLLRFTDILHDRLDQLCGAFNQAIEQDGYQGHYTAVYPIKVNQQRSVVDQIVHHQSGQVGLEAGSKPELMAVMALSPPGATIVCNGYKDREYIRLALIGRALGLRIYIVVEKLSELQTVIEESQSLQITPLLGVRVKLASIGVGKWQNTGGEKSKFGLTTSQLLTAIERLEKASLTDSLQMLHFHLGSQLPNIRDIQRGLHECARHYAELHKLGVNIRCVDIGGGLGVDYEGTRSQSFCSVNYTINEYAHNVVHTLWEVCEQQNLPHPDIISESGRALTAHHAVLVTNVIDTDQLVAAEVAEHPEPNDGSPIILQDMWRNYETLSQLKPNRSLREIYHDLQYALNEAQSMYVHGVLTLAQRAQLESLYYTCCQLMLQRIDPAKRHLRPIQDELNEKLASKYFCNFSLFQSLPDVWAIKQIFPIAPIHRLLERPTQRVVIEDITCDSDGRIDQYVDDEGVESSLPLHQVKSGEPYLIGMFLVGAYQEILGDMHNLFGDTDSIDVSLTSDGDYQLSNPLQGDTVDSVLRYVHFDVKELLARYQQKLASSEIEDGQRKRYLEELENGLHGYTYLEE